MLGVKTPVIRGLVAQGRFDTTVGYRPGLSKLIPAAQVWSFADQYVAATILAQRFNLNRRRLSSYIKESGAPLLTVPTSEEGRGPAFLSIGFHPAQNGANFRTRDPYPC